MVWNLGAVPRHFRFGLGFWESSVYAIVGLQVSYPDVDVAGRFNAEAVLAEPCNPF